MEATEFLKKVKEYRQRQLFYLYGAEDYLIDTTVKQLTEALRVENFDFNYSICRGKAEYMEIADLCRQLPCFAQHRVVVLEDLDLFEKSAKMPELLKALPEYTKLIIVRHGKLDSRKAFAKALMKSAVCVECAPLKEVAMLRWIMSSAKKKGIVLSKDMAGFILEVCGGDMYAIQNEMNKLKYYPKGQSREGLQEALATSIEYDTFSFHKLMRDREYEKAMDILRKVQKDRRDLAGFIGLIISKFTPAYMAKSCLNAGWTQRMTVEELVKAGIKEYPAKLACGDAAHFTMQQLKRALRLLETVDFSMKSGGGNKGLETAMLMIYGAA